MARSPRITSPMRAEGSVSSYRHIAQSHYNTMQWGQDPDSRLLVHADSCPRWQGLACACDVDILHLGPRMPGG